MIARGAAEGKEAGPRLWFPRSAWEPALRRSASRQRRWPRRVGARDAERRPDRSHAERGNEGREGPAALHQTLAQGSPAAQAPFIGPPPSGRTIGALK